MTPEILSFLSKLPPLPKGGSLYKDGPLVELAVRRVREYIQGQEDSLDETAYMKLGLLLQHTTPNNFTVGELKQIACLPIDLLDNNINERLPKVVRPGQRMFDSGSPRTQRVISRTGFDMSRYPYIYARSISTTPRNLVLGAIQHV